MKIHLRNNNVILTILSIFMVFLLTGCGNEGIAKRALEKRYGEEFEVRSIYTDYRKHFFATCAPVNNEDIVFTAKITTSGEILESNYTEAILGKQIKDIIYPEIEKMWPGAYVAVQQMHNKELPTALVDLFIPKSVADKWSIEEEYKFWSEDIGQMILQHKIPRLSVGAWILDDDRMGEADEFYKTTEPKITFLENEFGYMTFHFGYDENTLKMISFEDYKKRRIKE
ncbi:MAG: hypothetical protein K6E53_09295 [Lachnospiraceae bacterium]|nr:hypothetical protein [Lachnospiraceae bacterium]